MDKRSPDDIRKSIKSLVEEAENVSIDDDLSDNSSPSKEKVVKSKLEAPPSKLEDKYKPDSKVNPETEEKDLDLMLLLVIHLGKRRW